MISSRSNGPSRQCTYLVLQLCDVLDLLSQDLTVGGQLRIGSLEALALRDQVVLLLLQAIRRLGDRIEPMLQRRSLKETV